MNLNPAHPPMDPATRARRELAALAAGAVLLGLALFAGARSIGLAVPSWPGMPACPWRATLGFPCPGCGGTRALDRLAAGDLGAALELNALVVIASLGILFVGAVAIVSPASADRVLEGGGHFARTRRARIGLLALFLGQMLVARG